jgi:hypothetical protein
LQQALDERFHAMDARLKQREMSTAFPAELRAEIFFDPCRQAHDASAQSVELGLRETPTGLLAVRRAYVRMIRINTEKIRFHECVKHHLAHRWLNPA